MPRIVWFALGAVAGVVYASQAIPKQHPELAEDQLAQAREQGSAKAQNLKTRLADMLDEQSTRISELVCEQGHMLAERLRGTPAQTGSRITGSPYGEPLIERAGELTPASGLEMSR
jgi:hypothetical protein